MHHSVTLRLRTLALASLLAVLGAPAAAQSTNGVTMLRIANGPGGEILKDESTTLHTMSWNIADADAQAYSTFNDRGTGLAFCSAGRDSGASWDIASRLYGGDVVVFKVAGAAPTQVTTLNITVKALGSGSTTTTAALDYCIGSTVAGRCPSALDPVVAAQLKLPLPTRVKAAGGDHIDALANNIFDYQHTVALKIKGAKAVVPLWYSMEATCERNAKATAASASSQLASMELVLPTGVTCTSRTGKAFNAKCPAAAL
ncbi:MAG TPA: hypothetical protein VFY73_25085 [Ideonella sp.]|uniref:hypothetical protein n=1 Tax=Ideonella sp. TaxID=1929293 RepID=UPI002E369C5F|nr:hypothetical protein [Ideonella sp.]HEX5687305.1 hypothetical protein [Ideonella sp.]